MKTGARRCRDLWTIRHGYGATQVRAVEGLHPSQDGTQNALHPDMSKVSPLSLSDRDKTPAPSGWGHNFHHTDPQRRIPCVLGDMLAPRSADDIPPITPAAMASVQAAITLLANLVGDLDHGRFLGVGNAKLEEYREKARAILSMGRSLAGILRVITPPTSVEEIPSTATGAPVTSTDELPLADVTSPTIELCVQLSSTEITALAMAYEHACVSMAHPYSSGGRDITMGVVSKVLSAARTVIPAPTTIETTTTL